MIQPSRPLLHIEFLVKEILTQEYSNQWWVVWYHSDTLDSAGMDLFPSFQEALEWDMEHPPSDPYNRSTIVYSGA